MLFSSLNVMLTLSKTISSRKLFGSDCISLYIIKYIKRPYSESAVLKNRSTQKPQYSKTAVLKNRSLKNRSTQKPQSQKPQYSKTVALKNRSTQNPQYSKSVVLKI